MTTKAINPPIKTNPDIPKEPFDEADIKYSRFVYPTKNEDDVKAKVPPATDRVKAPFINPLSASPPMTEVEPKIDAKKRIIVISILSPLWFEKVNHWIIVLC